MIILQLLEKLFEDGGWVIWPILAVSIAGFYIGMGKVTQIYRIQNARKRFLKALHSRHPEELGSTGFKPYDRLLSDIKDQSAVTSGYIRHSLQEFLLQVMPSLDDGLSTMSTCVSVAPLLGLLGTITGMNRMFDVINSFGLGSPTLMAEGISIALEATLAGLTVAVAVMFFHNYLQNRKEALANRILKDAEELTGANLLQPPAGGGIP